MTIQHQTWSPNTCGCVIEQQFDDAVQNAQPELLFFHKICTKHEPIVKNKKKLKMKDWESKRDKIIAHKEKLLRDNRIRHLDKFENDPERKQKLNLLKDPAIFRYSQRMEHELNEDRRRQESFLDGHERNAIERLLLGTYAPYAFIAQEVYDRILKEQKEINVP